MTKAGESAERSHRYLVLALVVLWGLAGVAMYNLNEDAFISFRYTENLVAGEGLVYNPGVRDEGYSNLFWVLLLALPTLLGIPLTVSAPALGLLCGAAAVYLSWIAARRLLPERPSLALAAPVMTALFHPLLFWAGSGLETSLFTLLLLAAVVTHLRPAPGRVPWTGILLGLAAWTRPEGLAFVVVFLAHHWLCGRRGEKTGSDWRDLVVVLALVAAQFVFRRLYYGLWLPLPAYVKSGGSFSQLKSGVGYILFWFILRAPLVPGLLALWALISRRRQSAVVLLGLLIAAQFAFIVYAGGDYMVHHRFLVPVIPLLALLALPGLDDLRERLERREPRRKTAGLVVWLAPLLFVLWSLYANLPAYHQRLSADPTELHSHGKQLVGVFLKESLPGSATLACGSAGAVPYYSGLVNHDFAGLCSAEAALNGEIRREGMAGHHLAYPELVEIHEPWVVIINPNPTTADDIGAWLRGETATPRYALEELSFPNRAVLAHPALERDYRPMLARVDQLSALSGQPLYVTFYARRGAAENALSAAGAVPVVLPGAVGDTGRPVGH